MDHNSLAERRLFEHFEEVIAFPQPLTIEDWERLEMLEITETPMRRMAEELWRGGAPTPGATTS